MRLVTYGIDTPLGVTVRSGALSDGDRVVDLNRAYCSFLERRGRTTRARQVADALVPTDMLELVRGGRDTLEAIGDAIEHALIERTDRSGNELTHPLGAVRLRAPLPRPNSLRDFLLVERHYRNSRGKPLPVEWYNHPIYYKGNMDVVFGPEDDIPWPCYSETLDYEFELCAVIGSPAYRVTADEARNHIFGYTILNDWTAVAFLRREQTVNLGPAQGKDFANSLGPCIVTADEFDPYGAVMRACVNGEVWSEGVVGDENLSVMQFSFPEVIEWISMEQPLQPGDLLGTTFGLGCGRELGRLLEPRSVVELEVEGIGVLRNRVGVPPEGEPTMIARTAKTPPAEALA